MDTYRRRVMARLWIVAAISLLSPPFAGPAVAGLISSAEVSLCGQTVASSGSGAAFVLPVSADCGNFTAAGSAEARAGFISMGTAASFLAHSTGPSNVLNQARAEARSEDILTPQGLPAGTLGRLVFTFDISGENHAEVSSISAEGFAHTQLVGQVTNSFFRFNVRDLTLDAAEYDHFMPQFDFGIVYGEPNTLELHMISLSRVRLSPIVAAHFTGLTDFADTITLTSVDLLDVNGQPVPNASLSAASGTRYPLTGDTGGGSISVPEPSSVLLLTTGLISLYFGRIHLRCAWRSGRRWPS